MGGPDGGGPGERSYSIEGWGGGEGMAMRLVWSERSLTAASLALGSWVRMR